MTCENFDDTGTIERYLAGKLPEPEGDAFEQHYFACDRCWKALRLLRATRDALRAAGAPAPLASDQAIECRSIEFNKPAIPPKSRSHSS
jgi:anti-sigma factor RsiW